MWGLRKKGGSECWKALDLLEAAAPARGGATTLEEFLLLLPEGARKHVLECLACRAACQELLETRELLEPIERKKIEPGPFFVNRVLAAIRAREDEVERSTRAWAVVPRLASRLACIAALVLLVAGTWLYEGPRRHQAIQPSMEQGNAIFEDNAPVPTSKDEVLVSLLEKGQ
jgi:hypothetical protein